MKMSNTRILNYILWSSFVVTMLAPITGIHIHKVASTIFLLMCFVHTLKHKEKLNAKRWGILCLIILAFVSGIVGSIYDEYELLLNLHKVDPTETPQKEFIYVDIDAVGNGTGIWRKDKIIKGKAVPSRARRYAHKDSVIISTVRPNLKGFAYIDEEIENAVYSTGFAVIESQDTEKLLNKLLYYEFMYSDKLMEQMINAMPKGQYPSINKDDINNLELIVPGDKKIQESLLVDLDRYEERLKKARNSIATSSARKQAIMDKYLK